LKFVSFRIFTNDRELELEQQCRISKKKHCVRERGAFQYALRAVYLRGVIKEKISPFTAKSRCAPTTCDTDYRCKRFVDG